MNIYSLQKNTILSERKFESYWANWNDGEIRYLLPLKC